MSTEGGLTPTASMIASERETEYGPPYRSECREPFFSGAVALSIAIDDFAKGCYTWTT
jgi:hypothetical protein